MFKMHQSFGDHCFCVTMDTQSLVHKPIASLSNEETFLTRCSGNSTVKASKLLVNLEEMFPWYCIHSYVFRNTKTMLC